MTRLPETRALSTACKCCLRLAIEYRANICTAAAERCSAVLKAPRRHTNQMKRNLTVVHINSHSSARLAAQQVAQ